VGEGGLFLSKELIGRIIIIVILFARNQSINQFVYFRQRGPYKKITEKSTDGQTEIEMHKNSQEEHSWQDTPGSKSIHLL